MASDYLLGFSSREGGKDTFDLNRRLEPDIYIYYSGRYIYISRGTDETAEALMGYAHNII